jgi:hypothetical protein
MIDHCEFPYGEPTGLFGGDPIGVLLLLILVFGLGVAFGVLATRARRGDRLAEPAD